MKKLMRLTQAEENGRDRYFGRIAETGDILLFDSAKSAQDASAAMTGGLYESTEAARAAFQNVCADLRDMVFRYNEEEQALEFYDENYLEAFRLSAQRALRVRRERLFAAFDIYKTNVQYGIDTESAETHAKLVDWYKQCLSLNEISVTCPPPEIKRYLTEETV